MQQEIGARARARAPKSLRGAPSPKSLGAGGSDSAGFVGTNGNCYCRAKDERPDRLTASRSCCCYRNERIFIVVVNNGNSTINITVDHQRH